MKDSILYKIIRLVLIPWFVLTYKPIIINKKSIPQKGRCILAGNHTNNMDVFLLGLTTKRCIRYISKDELIKGPAKFFFKRMGIVPVNRKIKDGTVIPAATQLLKNERIIGIFPEGTINRTEDIIMPFKYGAVKMAIEGNAPILPFAISAKYPEFKRGVKIIFGNLYYPETKDILKETKILETKVISLLKECE